MSGSIATILTPDLERAIQLHISGNTTQAEILYRQVLQKDPEHSKALQYLGVLLFQQKQVEEALELLVRATKCNPNDSEAWGNLGNALRTKSRGPEAVNALERAIAIDPRNASALSTLSACLRKEGTLNRAINVARDAIKVQPNLAQAHINLGNCLLESGEIRRALAALEQALYLDPRSLEALQSYVFALHYSDARSLAQIYQQAHRFAALANRDTWEIPNRELRTIAFLSGDFCQHPVSYFMAPILQELRGTSLNVILLSNGDRKDTWTDKIIALGDKFIQIQDLEDHELATICSDNQVDVLIDLAGHTASNRCQAVAKRLAPIQISYLGYSGTTGLQNIDWILADAETIEPSDRMFYCESIAEMPDSLFCFDPSRITNEVTQAPFEQNGYITFGSFNNLSKITPSTLDTWAGVLNLVPQSKIRLKSLHLGEESIANSLKLQLSTRGINPERILTEGYTPGDNHYDSLGSVDIALDSFPYSGATTTIETLIMGVPVITLRGDRYAGRMSASLIRAIGRDSWICGNQTEYVESAVGLAKNTDQIAEARQSLRGEILNSPLCNSKTFTANFTSILRKIWQDSTVRSN